ncbi:MAG: hypothetical protein LBD29_11560 [Treponema sp.]|nr:hypothetical protein [Treponema sp.]
MKRVILVILLGLIAFTAFADEESDFYTEQFQNALTAVDQLSILRIVRAAEIEDSGSFYAYALDRVLQVYPNLKGQREFDAADEAIRLITDQLTEDQSDTGENLWRVVQTFSNPLVRMDAIIALGKVQATNFIPHVVQILKDTNVSPYANRLSGERIAYGAITALKTYKDPAGYLPVFFAANGWYSTPIKKEADNSLAEILEDPTEPLTEVIHSGGYTFEDKFLALSVLETSDVDDGAKAKAAIAALYEGWKGFTSDAKLKKEQVRLRKLAIDMIGRYGIDSAEDEEKEQVYKLLERSYRYGVDEEEHLGVVSALKNIASDESVKLLSTFLELMNNKLERQILTQQDERYTRALIPAIGGAGNSAGKPVIRRVLVLDWNAGIHQLAAEADKNIGQ